MIIRIVKMTFEESHLQDFLVLFESKKSEIRNFLGCSRLELLQDVNSSNVVFTHSYWESEEFLETYRKSDLFKSVWSITKTYFKEKPEAWSLDSKFLLT